LRKRSDLAPLNAILDFETATRAGWSLAELAAACLAGGARFLQLRAKQAPSGWLLDQTRSLVAEVSAVGGTLIVNDRADVAKLARAHGVHVGQDDLGVTAVRRILGDDALVGVSTHTIEQVEAAVVEPVDYVAVGPVFGTSSKVTGYEAVGLGFVREAAARVHARGLQVVAIGGITIDLADEVIRAGADSVAVIRDLLATSDPQARVREYIARLGRSAEQV
jgi:thiamine-phosphate pyrophosphorylase